MKLKLKNNKGKNLKIGDSVTIIIIEDDSADAIDLYGVEPHLGGWVEIVYLQKYTGIIEFDQEQLMYVITNKKQKYPLSAYLRSHYIYSNFERLDNSEKKTFLEEENMKEINEEILINYLD